MNAEPVAAAIIGGILLVSTAYMLTGRGETGSPSRASRRDVSEGDVELKTRIPDLRG
jgi:hypothetical protein